MNTKVLAIVVTYNGVKWIRRCLGSLLSSTFPIDILVIDNGSTDGTREIIEAEYRTIRLIKSDINLFFGQGNNIGLKIALNEDYEYVFLINQDAYIDQECIAELVAIAKDEKEYGIIAPLHLHYEGSGLEEYFKLISKEEECPSFLTDYYNQNLKDIYPIKFIHAAAWFIPVNVIQEIGGFDPIFKHYSEDIDYVNRTQFKGFKVGLVPKAKFYHFGSHEGLRDFHKNLKFRFHFNVLKLKNLDGSAIGVTFLFFRGSLSNIISSLISLSFPNFLFELKLFNKTLIHLYRILNSRGVSKNSLAYLK